MLCCHVSAFMLIVIMLSIAKLVFIIFSVILQIVVTSSTKCHYALSSCECLYADCHYVKYRYAWFIMFSVITFSVIFLIVIAHRTKCHYALLSCKCLYADCHYVK
jgi:hypothetical protein